jgi:multidrug efflux system membrane fusion protein
MTARHSPGPVLLLLAGGLLAFAGCEKKSPAPASKPVRSVTAAKAQLRDVPIYLDEIGKTAAFETVTIQPQVTGQIVEVHFKDGAEVKKGDLLFTLDPRPFEAALHKAQAALAQSRAKSSYDQAQLKRNRELSRTKAVALQALDIAESNAVVSAAAVAADEAAVEAAQINLDYCSIRSPISGRTSKRMVDSGNVVEANKTQLLLIQRQSPIYVDFSIPESELARVRHYKAAGTLKVEMSFPDDPSISREGEFDFLDSGVQPNAGVVRMRAVMQNEDRLFWPGQFVNVRLRLDTLKQAVLVPDEAVQVGRAGPFVFVVKDDSTVDLRRVKPGQRHDKEVVVTEGVKENETVVVSGQVTLAPGTTVSIVQP